MAVVFKFVVKYAGRPRKEHAFCFFVLVMGCRKPALRIVFVFYFIVLVHFSSFFFFLLSPLLTFSNLQRLQKCAVDLKPAQMVKASAHDDGGGKGARKKREKKGFKCDRYENYQRTRAKGAAGQASRGGKNGSSDSSNHRRVKAITFDEDGRREFLLTMHKNKNERRVRAFVDMKQKLKRENAKTRRAQREEARQAYNRFAAVPILPNFVYKLPKNCVESEHDGLGVEEKEATNVGVADDGVAAGGHYRLVDADRTVHVMPSAMCVGDHDAPTLQCSSLLDDYVTVEVKPLNLGRSTTTDAKGAALQLPANDFSDLPAVVEQEMLRLKKELKGPTRTKPRLRMMKELTKIRKIKQHSRKGHGKKTAKGKKKNRR